MIESINLEEPVEYICREDRDSDNPTIWKFKPLTYKEERFLKSVSRKMGMDETGKTLIDEHATPIHIALCGVDNYPVELKRKDKVESVFGDTKPLTDKTLSQIPLRIRDELSAFVIRGYSELKKEELKN